MTCDCDCAVTVSSTGAKKFFGPVGAHGVFSLINETFSLSLGDDSINKHIGVCVYYCRTYYKAVRGGGRRRVDDLGPTVTL